MEDWAEAIEQIDGHVRDRIAVRVEDAACDLVHRGRRQLDIDVRQRNARLDIQALGEQRIGDAKIEDLRVAGGSGGDHPSTWTIELVEKEVAIRGELDFF